MVQIPFEVSKNDLKITENTYISYMGQIENSIRAKRRVFVFVGILRTGGKVSYGTGSIVFFRNSFLCDKNTTSHLRLGCNAVISSMVSVLVMSCNIQTFRSSPWHHEEFLPCLATSFCLSTVRYRYYYNILVFS